MKNSQEVKQSWKKVKNRQIFGSCQRAEKDLEHEINGDTNCSLYLKNAFQRPGKKTGVTEEKTKNWDYLDHSTVKIC